jgi:hypothetical protein
LLEVNVAVTTPSTGNLTSPGDQVLAWQTRIVAVTSDVAPVLSVPSTAVDQKAGCYLRG